MTFLGSPECLSVQRCLSTLAGWNLDISQFLRNSDNCSGLQFPSVDSVWPRGIASYICMASYSVSDSRRLLCRLLDISFSLSLSPRPLPIASLSPAVCPTNFSLFPQLSKIAVCPAWVPPPCAEVQKVPPGRKPQQL